MNNSDKVKNWRKRTKDRIVEAFGNKCCICGGKFSQEIYDLHHVDPKQKKFSLGSIRSNSKAWNKIVEELRKCIMVCSNCHRSIHYGHCKIPDNAPTFNESFADYKKITKLGLEVCPICKKKTKLPYNITCSLTCAAKRKNVVDWDNINLLSIYNKFGSYTEVGRQLGVSATTIRRRVIKLSKVT